jgi:hypothetical protein
MNDFYSTTAIKRFLQEEGIYYVLDLQGHPDPLSSNDENLYALPVSDITEVSASSWSKLLALKMELPIPEYNGFLIWLTFSARSKFSSLGEILKGLRLNFERYYHFFNDLILARMKQDGPALKYIYETIYTWIPFVDFYRYRRQDLAALGINSPAKLLPKFTATSPNSGIKIVFVQSDQNVGESFDTVSHSLKRTNRYAVIKDSPSMYAVHLVKVNDRGPACKDDHRNDISIFDDNE